MDTRAIVRLEHGKSVREALAKRDFVSVCPGIGAKKRLPYFCCNASIGLEPLEVAIRCRYDANGHVCCDLKVGRISAPGWGTCHLACSAYLLDGMVMVHVKGVWKKDRNDSLKQSAVVVAPCDCEETPDTALQGAKVSGQCQPHGAAARRTAKGTRLDAHHL